MQRNVLSGMGRTVSRRPRDPRSGSEKIENSSSGPLVGLDVGPEFRLSPRFSIAVEGVYRYTGIEIEWNVRGGYVGVQLVALWRGSGR
jgi:hypothetical protein